MTTVRKLLETKENRDVVTVASTDTVYHALEVMAEFNVGAVLVTEDDKYVGIFTERDYARKVILKGRDSRSTPVQDIMTREMVTVTPDATVEQCAATMIQRKVRHLPVVENGRMVGMVSIRTIALQMVANRDSTIAELENYIMGTGYGR
jgi:CBS domain-containing protein